MKILAAEQIQKVDKFTIDNEPIASIELMERAANAFTDIFFEVVSPKKSVAIVCGRGNNGGDGLAIGRLLIERQYDVSVYIVEKQKGGSEDFEENLERLEKLTDVGDIDSEGSIPDFENYDVIIDGLFGSGLSRPVEGLYADIIESINSSYAFRVAIDISSGLFADKPSGEGAIFEADFTISFQLPKLAFLLPENFKYVGEWHIADIGLLEEGIEEQDTNNHLITSDMASGLLIPREKFDHKGNNGRALIMTGSYGKMGASVLSGRAALRSGVGLLTMYIPACGYEIIQTSIPEAMAEVDEGDHFLTTCPELESYDAVGIGPGIGKEQETMMSLIEAVRSYDKPIVLDADALNIISEHREILEMLRAGSIITPHPKEFERIVGEWENDFDRLEKQKQLAKKHKLIVIVKGAHTTVATPDGTLYFNSSGNAGMATGGTGDVLTGILTALLAQGYEPEAAAVLGIYIHGLAGDFATEDVGEIALIASDIIYHLPTAIEYLNS